MIFNMIGSGGSSDKSTIIVRTEPNSTVGIYTDDSYSTLIKEATYKGLLSYVTISNQESSCPNYSNYWYFERYNTLSANTMEACDAATPVDARYYADSTISTSMNIADSYTARVTTYVYSPIDQTLSISCTTDDDGTVYLNDTVLATLTSTKAKTVSFPLVAGINKITIIYTEGNGADGWVTNPLFSVNSNITAMWGTYEPMTITIDKTQLASKLGFTSRYCNFIYNGIDWTLDGNTINLSEYGITYAATNTIGMYINFVYKYNIYGEYWLQNLNNGIYYLKATKGNLIRTETYIIDKYGVYRLTMGYTITITLNSLLSTAETITYSSTGGDSGTASVKNGTPAEIIANPNDTYTFTSDSTIWTKTIATSTNDISVNCWFGTALYWYGYSNTEVVSEWSRRNGTATYNTNYIDFHATANNAQFYTSSTIDISDYSTLSLYGQHVGQLQSGHVNAFGIASSGTDTAFVASATVNTTLQQYPIDISAQTGTYYIKYSLYSYNAYIYAIWLE